MSALPQNPYAVSRDGDDMLIEDQKGNVRRTPVWMLGDAKLLEGLLSIAYMDGGCAAHDRVSAIFKDGEKR